MLLWVVQGMSCCYYRGCTRISDELYSYWGGTKDELLLLRVVQIMGRCLLQRGTVVQVMNHCFVTKGCTKDELLLLGVVQRMSCC